MANQTAGLVWLKYKLGGRECQEMRPSARNTTAKGLDFGCGETLKCF